MTFEGQQLQGSVKIAEKLAVSVPLFKLLLYRVMTCINTQHYVDFSLSC